MTLFNNPNQRVIHEYLLTSIAAATRSLKIAVTWFTHHDLFDAVFRKLKNEEVSVELIVLNDRINNKSQGVNFQELIDAKGDFYFSGVDQMVHHKFCIIDDVKVITGSYNWTYYAQKRNWENVSEITDKELVNGYVAEFLKITQHHQKVENVAAVRKYTDAMGAAEFLQTDYLLQAERNIEKGDSVAAAKVYTELVKINPKQEYQLQRTKIINELNKDRCAYLPFEIGILFQSGYATAIPAFSLLPAQATRNGATVLEGQIAVEITIQKFDIRHSDILKFTFSNLQPSPAGTTKVEHYLHIDNQLILTVSCKELNGGSRITPPHRIDLKKLPA
jgi:hypothetical protein